MPSSTVALATIVSDEEAALALAQEIHEANERKREAVLSESTRRGYIHWRRRYADWCQSFSPPFSHTHVDAVSAFLNALEDDGLTLNSIRAAQVAISVGFTQMGLDPNPARTLPVRQTMKAITLRKGAKSPNRKRALLLDDLRTYLEADDDGTLRSLRDRAVLVTGFALAARRSELVALDVHHLEPDAAGTGFKVIIERSKTDQTGKGMSKHLPKREGGLTDPVTVLRAWMKAAGIKSGPLFRPIDQYGHVVNRRLSGWSVSEITKRAADGLNLDPASFGAHSLRRGFITTCAKQGIDVHAIRRQSGHASIQTVALYIEEERPDLHNAVGMIGL